MRIEEPNFDIIGAENQVGKAFAREVDQRFPERGSIMLIGGREKILVETLHVLRGGDVGVFTGDIFNPESSAFQASMRPYGDITALIEDFNMDYWMIKGRKGKNTKHLKAQHNSREIQNALLRFKLEAMKNNDPEDPKLFLVMNSINSLVAELLGEKVTSSSVYARMKLEQFQILSAAREELKAAGVELSIIKPGIIDAIIQPGMDADEESAQTIKKAMQQLELIRSEILGKQAILPNGRILGQDGRVLTQDRVLLPTEVAKAMTDLVEFFLVNGEIPPQFREWIMLNESDLVVPKAA